MRHVVIAVIGVFLWTSHVSAQTPIPTQRSITGSAIPDAAAWRIWFNMKGEVPGNHSEKFTTYLASLKLPAEDSAILQSVLETYATKSAALISKANVKIEAADDNNDEATATSTQNALQTQLAALVSATQVKLASSLSSNGAAFLTDFMQNEKRHMTISPSDVSLTQTRSVIFAEPAAYHAHGSPQGSPMTFTYSSYGSSWISVTGRNSNGDPYGTYYTELGAEGTTSPCSGVCLSAIHTSRSNYSHTGGGGGNYQLDSAHANAYINGWYTYSWPFDVDTNFFWPDEFAMVTIVCSSVGTFFGNNPVSPPSSGPFQTETATTYTTLNAQFTCLQSPTCTTSFTVHPYCFSSPDYNPTQEQIVLNVDETVFEFKQFAVCERPGTSGAWNCGALYPDDIAYSDGYIPPGGGAACSHHP
jgi:hypothetical protein